MSEPTNGQGHVEGEGTKIVKACVRLGLLNKTQVEMLKRHLDPHKYHRHIPPERIIDAVYDFNNEFGWVMREMVCTHACQEGRENRCESYSDWLKSHNWQQNHARNVISRARMIQGLENKAILPSCVHLADFLNKFETVVLTHLGEHVYFNGIADRKQAIENFVERFGFAAREIYCDIMCPDNQKCDNYKKYLERFKANTNW